MNLYQLSLASLTLLFLSCQAPEEPLVLDAGQIEHPFHKAHAGELIFQTQRISLDKLKEEDISSAIEWEEGEDLFLYLLLEKTQTHYLDQLAPGLTVEELCKKGSYQFTFFVDGDSIYQENIQTGAGSCWFRNSVTHPVVLFISDDDHWGKYTWLRFMKEGGAGEFFGDGQAHEIRIEVRPYIQLDDLSVGPIIAQGQTQLTLFQKSVDPADIIVQSIKPKEGWTISEESYDQALIEKLNKRIAQEYFKDITSLVVLKNGELLIEEYFNDANRETLHDTRSVGKSFCGSLFGIALADGHIAADAVLSDFYKLKDFENYSSVKAATSPFLFLSMTSAFDGYDFDPQSPGNEENMYPKKDWVKFVLDLPINQSRIKAGTWSYFTAGVVLLGDIINKSTPKGLEIFAENKLFAPLGIEDYEWSYRPDGVPSTAGGFKTNSLNFARYGQLYLDRGLYNDQQIIPENWVQKSMSARTGLPQTIGPGAYGYLFWIKDYEIAGNTYKAVYASGNGGNKIVMIEELGLVIVLTATAYNQPYMHIQADEIIGNYILPAILNS